MEGNYKTFENGVEVWFDHKGKTVPRKNIKDLDIYLDNMVRELGAEAENLSSRLRELKKKAFECTTEYLALVAASYDTKYDRNKKGNYVLDTYNKDSRMQIVNQSILDFDSVRLAVAKSQIDECIKSWSNGANDNLRILIDDAFKVDKKGCIDKKRILGLFQYKIEDENWKKAMETLKDSICDNAKAKYVRFFKRNADGKLETIVLDIAAV